MAKKVNIQLLAALVQSATGFLYLTGAEGKPLVDAGFAEANTSMTDPNDPNKVAVRATDAGKAHLASVNAPAASTAGAGAVSAFAVISNAALPIAKRGGGSGGAPAKYPFAELELNQSFFVPVSPDMPDPVKTLGSTISGANHRYATQVGEKTVTRTKRGDGNRALKDGNGNNVKETVTVPTYEYSRKFSIRRVEAGVQYGEWKAPADGALIMRVK